MNEHLLKAKEVAERLNISRSQAFYLMRNGDIATVRFGKLTRVRPEDLEEFIDTNMVNPTKNLLAATNDK
jgi:excisionase family DNA binding protein